MTPNEKIAALGIDLEDYTPPGDLAPATRVGNTIYTSGHVSVGYQGKLGTDFTTEEGQKAAYICAVQLLQAVYTLTGDMDKIKVVRLMGCVNSAPDFVDQHLVINGASDLFWDIYGKDGSGYHARSALGFGSLPVGFAVEIEGIFEVIE